MNIRHPDAALSAELLRQAAEWSADDIETDDESPRWTLRAIRDAAGVAASRIRMAPGTLRDDPHLLAASAIGLAVALDPDLSWSDAVRAGQREIWDEAGDVRESHGVSSRGGKPRFLAYWLDEQLAYARLPHVTRCETPLTLAAVLAGLPDRHVLTLAIAAFTDDATEASTAAGCSPAAWRERVRTARRAALALWFDGETPPALGRQPVNRRRRDRTCPAGHEISGSNVEIERRDGRVVERCRTCRISQQRARAARR